MSSCFHSDERNRVPHCHRGQRHQLAVRLQGLLLAWPDALLHDGGPELASHHLWPAHGEDRLRGSDLPPARWSQICSRWLSQHCPKTCFFEPVRATKQNLLFYLCCYLLNGLTLSKGLEKFEECRNRIKHLLVMSWLWLTPDQHHSLLKVMDLVHKGTLGWNGIRGLPWECNSENIAWDRWYRMYTLRGPVSGTDFCSTNCEMN